jgi:sugar phosphate isomerase/epimerase
MKLCYTVATPEVERMPIAWVGEPERAFGRLVELGYGAVELQTRDPDAFDTIAFAAKITAAGLTVAGISTGPAGTDDRLFLTAPDAGVRRAALARLTRALEFAAECGTHLTIGSIRGFRKWADEPGTGAGWFADALTALIGRAEQLGAHIVLEPQSRQVTDFANTVADALELIDGFGTDVLAIEADSYHMALEERSIPAALVTAQLSGRLRHVQISDSNRLAPGWGILGWGDFFATLDALGYEHWICIEASQLPDSETVAVQGQRLVAAMSRRAA